MFANETREFSTALCGFSAGEQKAIERAFKLSEVRPTRYVTWNQEHQGPEICLVNEDAPSGLESWRRFRDHFSTDPIPVMRIGAAAKDQSPFEGVFNVFFKRPLLANRILKTLDRLVAEVYRFVPESTIHDHASIPVDAPQQQPIAQESPATAKEILVVDDSESVRKMMELRLGERGHNVDFALTGEDAVIKAQQRPYDLIFLDVMLPGINGYDVSRKLKRDKNLQAPVVMLTSKTSRIDKLRGTLASADAYLTKPLAIESLNATLQRFLDN